MKTIPYKTIGVKVYHFKNGKWSVKQTCSSPANAKKAANFLRGLEHGMVPKKKKAKKRAKKKSKKK